MKQFAIILVGLTLVGSSIAAGPSISCATGYSPTAGACTSGESESTCINQVCTTSNGTVLVGNNGQCDVEDGTTYCAVCCPNTDYFVYPGSNQLTTAFDVGDSIDCVYSAETGPPSGVSTDCECGNGYIYSHFANNVIYGGWESYLEYGTQASFGNPDLQTNCGNVTASTNCNLTLHAADGQGQNGWGSDMAVLTGLSLVYTATTGITVGTLPTSIVSSTTFSSIAVSPTPTSTSVSVFTPTTSPVPQSSTTSPATSTTLVPPITSSAVPSGGKSGLSSGAIAGIVVGTVLGLALVGLLIFLVILMRRRERQPEPAFDHAAETKPHPGNKPYPEASFNPNNGGMPYNNNPNNGGMPYNNGGQVHEAEANPHDPQRISEVPGSPVTSSIGSPHSGHKAWGGS
ncbi:MAG: hypothetical protein MMC33_009547 [Icmadophila ericetorum]|nr:hypothetical protein [Icmadophila ericetorum]